ncbi:DUF5947 family protein [Actinacidiphila acididurans]|uniref:Uncharacterized protein n=1 Tax=Actinacidiphila acididurans TaxID=2784346 RepID=A0ABS2U3S6_9ACTN|nr:DUF5947 family protein [Actinacidiphila acididurans]MBM9510249.1 hypothetical protein [Actinacidiphila acididurans]
MHTVTGGPAATGATGADALSAARSGPAAAAVTAGGGLRRLARQAAGRAAGAQAEDAPERCELCAEPLPAGHRHLLRPADGSVACACRACALLFGPESSPGIGPGATGGSRPEAASGSGPGAAGHIGPEGCGGPDATGHVAPGAVGGTGHGESAATGGHGPDSTRDLATDTGGSRPEAAYDHGPDSTRDLAPDTGGPEPGRTPGTGGPAGHTTAPRSSEATPHRGYLALPETRQRLDGCAIDDTVWAALGIPVGLAFFTRSAESGAITAAYPSPLGAVRFTVAAESWRELARCHSALPELPAEVTALLVHRARGAAEHWLVPLDDCYRLVALVRAHWKGLGGGDEVWQRIDDFFRALNAAHRT